MSDVKRVRLETQASEGLRFVKLSPNAKAPVRSSEQAAGFDLFAAEEAVVAPGSRFCVATDLQISVPRGSYGRIAPRSGLAAKCSLDVGAGVVDADFRGNFKVLLFNFGADHFSVNRGDRIAQLILEKIHLGGAVEVQSLDDTVRGACGFGSIGLN